MGVCGGVISVSSSSSASSADETESGRGGVILISIEVTAESFLKDSGRFAWGVR